MFVFAFSAYAPLGAGYAVARVARSTIVLRLVGVRSLALTAPRASVAVLG